MHFFSKKFQLRGRGVFYGPGSAHYYAKLYVRAASLKQTGADGVVGRKEKIIEMIGDGGANAELNYHAEDLPRLRRESRLAGLERKSV
jgi:hypothetical protein